MSSLIVIYILFLPLFSFIYCLTYGKLLSYYVKFPNYYWIENPYYSGVNSFYQCRYLNNKFGEKLFDFFLMSMVTINCCLFLFWMYLMDFIKNPISQFNSKLFDLQKFLTNDLLEDLKILRYLPINDDYIPNVFNFICSLWIIVFNILFIWFIGIFVTLVMFYYHKRDFVSYDFGIKYVSIFASILTCFLSFYIFFNVALLKNPYYLLLGTWINSDTLYVEWSFLFDSLTATMLIVVTTVSALVHLYAGSYMEEDPNRARFMSYLSLFTFFMIILVTGDNFLQLFLGWEGVGLCSYLLISFWYTRVQANKAAIKAMLINRVGDFSLLLGILFIYFTFQSLDYSTVFILVPFFIKKNVIIFGITFNLLNVICFFLLIGAVGKSAQIGLHTWLPDAMEGPTPVSALIHAATMVTAGIFLIIRCSPLFEYSPIILNVITILGALTTFFAATVGLVQNDIKKIIAYSTCSQLGYMAFVCGTSNYSVGLFHLSNHAFFKALLFLGAGSVIHSLGNEQDIRKMGGLMNLLPYTYSMMLIGSLSIVGFPFLSGFYSKDVILEVVYTKYTLSSLFAYWLGTVTALLTAIYSFRLIYLVFLNKSNSYKNIVKSVHELPIGMGISLAVLSMGSIFTGYLSRDFFIGLGSDFFDDAIFVLPQNMVMIDAEFIPHYIKVVPTVFALFGICSSLFFNKYYEYFFVAFRYKKYNNLFYKFLVQKWYFDYIQNELVGKILLYFAYNIFFKMIDKGFLELLGPTGITFVVYKCTLSFRKLQTGYIYQYSFIIVFFFFVILTFLELIS